MLLSDKLVLQSCTDLPNTVYGEFNKMFSLTDKAPMDGDSEELSDVQGEDRSVVLWEKCIQQSIFVDLSEDESLHLSDLESSIALHLSQAESAASEASVHLSGKN